MSKIEELHPIDGLTQISEKSTVPMKKQSPSSILHEFEALLCPEEEGGFSVFALHYPGVISQGESLEEAKTNIAEAFIGMLESRNKHGEKMEFSQSPTVEMTPECQLVRVTIDG